MAGQADALYGYPLAEDEATVMVVMVGSGVIVEVPAGVVVIAGPAHGVQDANCPVPSVSWQTAKGTCASAQR